MTSVRWSASCPLLLRISPVILVLLYLPYHATLVPNSIGNRPRTSSVLATLGVIDVSTAADSRAASTVADVRLMEPIPSLKACSASPDQAPRFVKCGTGCAQQPHEEHALVEPVGCGPHAGEPPKLEMETLRNARLDRLEAITLQILERTIAGHCEFVREGSEFPALAAGVPPAHQCVAPIQIAAASDVDVDALIDSRVGKRDQRMPMAVQVGAIIHVIRALEIGGHAVGRWMGLQRRLRSQPHARAAPDTNDLLKPVAPEYAWGGRHEYHVQALALGKPSPNAERKLPIGPGQYGPTFTVEEGELQPCVPPDDPGWALVAMPRGRRSCMQFLGYAGIGCSYSSSRRIHVTTSSSPAPLLRFVKTNGRSR